MRLKRIGLDTQTNIPLFIFFSWERINQMGAKLYNEDAYESRCKSYCVCDPEDEEAMCPRITLSFSIGTRNNKNPVISSSSSSNAHHSSSLNELCFFRDVWWIGFELWHKQMGGSLTHACGLVLVEGSKRDGDPYNPEELSIAWPPSDSLVMAHQRSKPPVESRIMDDKKASILKVNPLLLIRES